jgi:hypothetical protein
MTYFNAELLGVIAFSTHSVKSGSDSRLAPTQAVPRFQAWYQDGYPGGETAGFEDWPIDLLHANKATV